MTDYFKQWDSTLDLSSIWPGPDDEYEPNELAGKIAERIRNHPFYEQTELFEVIARDLEDAYEDEEIDNCLTMLYNWGDLDKRLWIKTRF